jgi:hypothetical protein
MIGPILSDNRIEGPWWVVERTLHSVYVWHLTYTAQRQTEVKSELTSLLICSKLS